MAATIGERIKFEYPNEPRFSCVLTIVDVKGDGPDDLVLFEDGTQSKQKHLVDMPREAH